MPITVFDVKGVPGHRRERIEAGVVAGGKHVSASYDPWIAADPFKGGRLLITGPHGFDHPGRLSCSPTAPSSPPSVPSGESLFFVQGFVNSFHGRVSRPHLLGPGFVAGYFRIQEPHAEELVLCQRYQSL